MIAFVFITFVCSILTSCSVKNKSGTEKVGQKKTETTVKPENIDKKANISNKEMQTKNKTSLKLPADNIENMLDIQKVIYGFASAYFEGNRKIVKKYVYKTNDLEVYTDFYDTAEVYISCLKGLEDIQAGKKINKVNVSLEFLDLLISDDSYMYLSMELIKTKNGWRVKNYGLEK
ncbi:MAG: hypothetical protein HFH68_14350 [Lachnospiraceae bacterium]|nr:hypothetical protein [Lachnospiraceae bacterium]